MCLTRVLCFSLSRGSPTNLQLCLFSAIHHLLGALTSLPTGLDSTAPHLQTHIPCSSVFLSYLTGKTPSLVKSNSLLMPHMYLQLNIASGKKKKAYNFTDWTHFKFMTRNLKWAVVLVSIYRTREDFTTLNDTNKNFSLMSK